MRRATFSERVADLRRSPVMFPRDDYPHQSYGKQLLAVLAREMDYAQFSAHVHYAMTAMDRGLVTFPLSAAMAMPPRGWTTDMQALYAEERARPLRFEWGEAPGQHASVRAIIGEGRYDQVEVGHLSVERAQGLQPACAQDVAVLNARFGVAPTFGVVASTIRYAGLRRQGLGRAMYAKSLEELVARHGPINFVPHGCTWGDTSPDAERVWQGLRRQHPSVGAAIRVLR